MMKKFAIELKWAINYSIAILLWMILEKTLGWHDLKLARQPLYTNLFGLIAFVLYYGALLDKKKNFYNGKMSFKEGFISGMILAFFIAVLSPLMTHFTYTYITPSYFDKMINLLVAEKKQTLEQATAFYNLKSFIFQGISSSLSMGVTIGALISYFIQTKTKQNEK